MLLALINSNCVAFVFQKEMELLKLCALKELDEKVCRRLNQLVSQQVARNCTDCHGFSPLMLLCRNNTNANLLKLIKALLQPSSDNCREDDYVNIVARDGSTALLALCTYQHNHPDFIASVSLLIGHGANINAQNDQKRNALLILCSEHMGDRLIDMVRFLIGNQIDASSRDNHGNSASDILYKRGFTKNL